MAELGPLIPDESPLASRLRRRLRGISLEVLLFAAITLLSPLLLFVAFLVDATLWLRGRKPWMALRLLAMAWWFLAGELYGLIGLMIIWISSGGRDGERRRERVYALKRHWLIS